MASSGEWLSNTQWLSDTPLALYLALNTKKKKKITIIINRHVMTVVYSSLA